MFSFPAVTSGVAANASLPIVDQIFPLSIDPGMGAAVLLVAAAALLGTIASRMARRSHRVAPVPAESF